MKTVIIKIAGMRCAACASSVEHALKNQPDIDNACVNLTAAQAKVRYAGDKAPMQTIKDTVAACGYSVVNDEKPQTESANIQRNLTPRLVAALTCFIVLLALAIVFDFHAQLGLVISSQNLLFIAAAQLALSLPVIWAGKTVFEYGCKQLKAGVPCMDSLYAIAYGGAFFYSLYSIIAAVFGGEFIGKLYFAPAAAVMAFVIAGKYFAARAETLLKQITPAAVVTDALTNTLLKDGEEYQVTARELFSGDVIALQSGTTALADGIVTGGQASVDESNLTGAALPITKQKGDKILAGSVLYGGALTVKVQATYENTQLAQMMQNIKTATGKETAFKEERIAELFLPIVFSIAVITMLSWYFYSGSGVFAVQIFITVLLASCPCALGIATAAARFFAVQTAQKRGISVKANYALENIHKISMAVFCKTSALIKGSMTLTDIIPWNGSSERSILCLAAALEQDSLHPLAKALKAHAADMEELACRDIDYLYGRGVSGKCQNIKVSMGDYEYIKNLCRIPEDAALKGQRLEEEGKLVYYLAAGRNLCGIFAMQDDLRQGGAEAVSFLQQQGTRTVLITGDSKQAANIAGQAAGIEKIAAELSANDKAELVYSMQQGGELTAVIGGKACDAPAIAYADIGVAVSQDAAAAKYAQIALPNGDLQKLQDIIKISRTMTADIKQNIYLAFIFNIICLPGAVLVGRQLEPLYIMAAMLLGAAFVYVNALRIKL